MCHTQFLFIRCSHSDLLSDLQLHQAYLCFRILLLFFFFFSCLAFFSLYSHISTYFWYSLYQLMWPQTCNNPPSSAFWVMRFQACTTMFDFSYLLFVNLYRTSPISLFPSGLLGCYLPLRSLFNCIKITCLVFSRGKYSHTSAKHEWMDEWIKYLGGRRRLGLRKKERVKY